MRLSDLLAAYEADPDSPIRDVRPNTAAQYRQSIGVLQPYAGAELAAISGRDFKRWHRELADGRGLTTAGNAIKMVRLAVTFGIVVDMPGAADQCARLAAILDRMEFPKPPQRQVAMTYEQAEAFVAKALELGFPSLALAQAVQFETSLRQKDVIGEWLEREPGSEGGIVHLGRRWGGGLTFADIDAGILRKRTTKTGAFGEWDLSTSPLFGRAMAATPRQTGPLIVSEATGRPYRGRDFRRHWRDVARAAGLPDAVWNMDSRAGGISEAEDGGAEIEDMRLHATHSHSSTTRRYVRRGLAASRRVAEARQKVRSTP